MLGRCPRGAREEQGLLPARPRPTTTRRLAGPCCSAGRVLLPIGCRRCPPRGGAEAEECRWRRRRAQTVDSRRSPLGTTSRGRASPLPISMVNGSSGTRSMLKLSFTFSSSKASSVIEEEKALKKIVPKYSRVLLQIFLWTTSSLLLEELFGFYILIVLLLKGREEGGLRLGIFCTSVLPSAASIELSLVEAASTKQMFTEIVGVVTFDPKPVLGDWSSDVANTNYRRLGGGRLRG